jgi:serine phosphatase RsbU (regulator of sigma subunit)
VYLGPGERIVLMTDGVPEQPDLAGNQFGTARIEETLRTSGSTESDVKMLLAAVRSHAGGQAPADDTTIASVGPDA